MPELNNNTAEVCLVRTNTNYWENPLVDILTVPAELVDAGQDAVIKRIKEIAIAFANTPEGQAITHNGQCPFEPCDFTKIPEDFLAEYSFAIKPVDTPLTIELSMDTDLTND